DGDDRVVRGEHRSEKPATYRTIYEVGATASVAPRSDQKRPQEKGEKSSFRLSTKPRELLSLFSCDLFSLRRYQSAPHRDNHRLQECIPDALGRHLRILGNRKVHQ